MTPTLTHIAADVAGVVAFLLGDDARFLNGVEICTNCGFTTKAQ